MLKSRKDKYHDYPFGKKIAGSFKSRGQAFLLTPGHQYTNLTS